MCSSHLRPLAAPSPNPNFGIPLALPVVLSYPLLALSNSNGDLARCLGRTIIIDSQPVTVPGVLPRGFRGSNAVGVPNLWLPKPTWQQASLASVEGKPTANSESTNCSAGCATA